MKMKSFIQQSIILMFYRLSFNIESSLKSSVRILQLDYSYIIYYKVSQIYSML